VELGTDLRRHIARIEKDHPEATGEFTQLLGQITLAAKIVSRAVNKAGLAGVLGKTGGGENVFGEEQAELDVMAHQVFTRALKSNGGVCLIASEEKEEPEPVRDPRLRGKYMVTMDPLDGSSNIDYNVSIGTIFGIYRREPDEDGEIRAREADLLRPGRELVAAGYVIYGSSTMLVYTTGESVDGFTLDTSIGEFLLSHPGIEIPRSGGSYSVNASYYDRWEEPIRRSVDDFREDPDYTSRYIGSLVADFHRNLLGGGVFLYPNEPETPGKEQGKLRLLYEAAPLAMIVQQAGGRASDGERDILDIKPRELHQRVPLYIGSPEPVSRIENRVASTKRPVAEG